MPPPVRLLTLLEATLGAQRTRKNPRRLDDTVRMDYANGDQFGQNGEYWRGRKPTNFDDVKADFSQQDIISPSIRAIVDGVLGRDPEWSLSLPPAPGSASTPTTSETNSDLARLEAALTDWHHGARLHATLREAKRYSLTLGRASLRVYIPDALATLDPNNDQSGPLTAGSLPTIESALERVFIHAIDARHAGVIHDEHNREVGHWYRYAHALQDGTDEQRIEMHTPTDITVHRETSSGLDLISDLTRPNPLFDPERSSVRRPDYLMHFMRQEHGSVITPGVKDSQDHLNIAETDLRRNGSLYGFPIWVFKNLADLEEAARTEHPDGTATTTPADATLNTGIPVGPGEILELRGIEILDREMNIIGYATPDAERLEPVDNTPLLKEIDHHRANLLRAFDLLWTEAALLDVSGVSRQEARQAWDKRLAGERGSITTALSWAITTALRFASWLTRSDEDASGIIVTPRVFVDQAPADLALYRELRAANLDNQISTPTLLQNTPITDLDVDAEEERLMEEPPGDEGDNAPG